VRYLDVPASDLPEKKIHRWLRNCRHACILDGNDYGNRYPQLPFQKRMAGGNRSIEHFRESLPQKSDQCWWFGYLGYDLHGKQPGDNRDVFLNFSPALFFEAEAVFEWRKNQIRIYALDPEKTAGEVTALEEYESGPLPPIPAFTPSMHRNDYLQGVETVQELIREGHVYELNLCQYYQSHAAPDGMDFYLHLNQKFPMPFSGWYRSGDFEIACASPERFLRKTGSELISQPIKGTARRGRNEEEDRQIRQELFHSEKERAENMMIVDLVRNDLAKISRTGSTSVEEMFGVYAFPTVFQMISTVRSVLASGLNNDAVLDSAFPMGSMTGAPKQEVMKQIATLEPLRRGAYSGSLGYFCPGNDFDFNVLIRSLFINHAEKRCGFAVGSAITIDSDPESEWEECLAKASSLLAVCGH
jgi:para-aminobenzoate synthetase component 1